MTKFGKQFFSNKTISSEFSIPENRDKIMNFLCST